MALGSSTTLKVGALIAFGASAAAKSGNDPADGPGMNGGRDSPAITRDTGLPPDALAQASFPLFAFEPPDNGTRTASAPATPQTSPATTQPVATQPSVKPEPRTATEVVTAAIIDKAIVAVVRRSSEDERAAALRRFAQGKDVSAAGKYFIVEQCLQVMEVEEPISRIDPTFKTICIISACGGAGFRHDTRAGPVPKTPGAPPASDEPEIRRYASFTDPDARWLVFLLPVTPESLDEKGRAHLEEMQKAGLPIGDLYRLHSRRGGLRLETNPDGKDPAVVPLEFISDLRTLLSAVKQGEELKTPLARRVKEKLAMQAPGRGS